MNCWVWLTEIVGFGGVTAIDNNWGGVTVSDVLPLIVPNVAEMVVVPVALDVARPVFNPIAATLGLELVQLAVPVKLVVMELEKMPVALNCWFKPRAIEGATGVTAIDTSWAGVTVRVVLALIVPKVAVMFVVPVPTEVARPVFNPMVATEGLELVQLTEVVMLFKPVVKLPVAVNCWVEPRATDGLIGVTATESNPGMVTLAPVTVPRNESPAPPKTSVSL